MSSEVRGDAVGPIINTLRLMPRNAPCAIINVTGAMAFNGNCGQAHNYDPSTIAESPAQNPAYREPPVKLSGEPADKYDHRIDEGYYSQAGALYRLIPEAERDRLTNNIARALHGILQHIIDRQLGHFAKADADYAKRVAGKLSRLIGASLAPNTPKTA